MIKHIEKPRHNINQVQRKDFGVSSHTTQQGNFSWILDTGATNHVTNIKNIL